MALVSVIVGPTWLGGQPLHFRTEDAADAAHKLVLKKIYCMWKVFQLPLLANKS